MSQPRVSEYEARLQSEIEAIEAQIKELTDEKLALQRQLMKERRKNSTIHDVNRKNSVNRIMIENRVIEALSNARKRMNTRELYQYAKHIQFDLKESTFRTHLHRMKNKKMIENAGFPGTWRIPS